MGWVGSGRVGLARLCKNTLALTDSKDDESGEDVEEAQGGLAEGHVVDKVGPGKAEEDAGEAPQGQPHGEGGQGEEEDQDGQSWKVKYRLNASLKEIEF